MPAHLPFLSLPQEIRDQIYEYVSFESSSSGCLHPSGGGKIVSSSSLLLVSRAVSAEYKEALRTTAPVLSAVVQDFDFAHVIAFLDELLESQSEETARGIRAPAKSPLFYRKLQLILSLSRDCRKNLPMLNDWLKRISSQPTDHYGAAFTTAYSVHSSTSSPGSTSTVAPITLMQVIDVVHCDWYMQTSTGVLKMEMAKVCDCLGEIEMRINRLRTNAPPSGPRMGGLETF